MTDIEQLRKDIEQAKEIMLRFYKQDRQALGIGEMYDRLAKLEAEAAHLQAPPGICFVLYNSRLKKYLPNRRTIAIFKSRNAAIAHSSWLKNPLDWTPTPYTGQEDYQSLTNEIGDFFKEKCDRTADLEEANTEIYGDYLVAQARIAELEAELAKRPVVWCVRYMGNILQQSASPSSGIWDSYHFTGLFPTREDAMRLMRGEVEPYTGEQS